MQERYIKGSSRNLSRYLIESLVLEGGIAGHMKHPIDYEDFTGDDLMGLVDDIFTGKIEHMKEKLDGTNINAYRNPAGSVRFIRNQSDLNNEQGGMSIEEMSIKWADKPSVAKVFTDSGKIIEEVFMRVPVKFFNPDENTKVIVNCECITAGQTNVMVYKTDRVAFHGTSTYTKTGNGWELTGAREGVPSEISKAAAGIRGTEPRPDLILKSLDEGSRLASKFSKDIQELFKREGLSTRSTIDEWKAKRFQNLCPEWLECSDVYRRWFYGDKSIGLASLKKKYADHIQELSELDKKGYKEIVAGVMEPMDSLFGRIGNALISNLNGFTNSDESDQIASELRKSLDELVSDIKSNGTEDEVSKLERQLNRLKEIGDTINSAEGVVFIYRGRLMKLTGSFGALNQIMGMRKFSR